MNSNENNTNLNQNSVNMTPNANNLVGNTQSSVQATPNQTEVVNNTQNVTPTNQTVTNETQNVAQTISPVQSAQQVQSVQPTQTVQSVQPIQSVQPTQPAQPVQSTQPVQPVQPVQPAQSVQSAQPVQPAQQVQPVQTIAPTTVTPTATGQNESNEIVVNTTKKRTSNLILIILVFLMVLFVFNIDTVIDMYNNYVNNGTLTNNNSTTDNLANGFIMIDEASYMNLKEIRFYNFKKKEGSVEVTFNYEANQKYDDASELKIYIELYNSDKEIIYKELFNPGEPLEKGTIRTYTLSLTNDVYTSAFYTLAKIYTQTEENSTSTLVCKFNDDNENVTVNYEITYNFKNNGLTSYSVNKNYQLKGANTDNYVTELETEYNSVKDIIPSVVYENNTLQYSVNLETEIENFTPLYNKDTIINIIKQKETLKKWNCE